MHNGGCQHAVEECFSEISSVEFEAELVQIALKILGLYIVEDIEDCPLSIADCYKYIKDYD